jgi:phosphatidate cytidylyltransferase
VLRTRLLTAAIGIPLLLVVLLAGAPWLTLLLVALVVAAAVELSGLLLKAGFPVQPEVVGGLALFAAIQGALVVPNQAAFFAAWLVTAFVVAALVSIRLPEPTEGMRRFAGTVLGALAAAMLAFLLRIAAGARPDSADGPLLQWLDDGRIWLLTVVLTVWAYDTAAYAVGRLWGRGHFFNHISPNKTWSGAVGGAVGASLAGLLLGLIIGRPVQAFSLGILVGLVAPVGDLAESMIKRAAGVKDSSRLFPGHGGLLDRVDSFLTVAPAAWLYLVIAGLAY